MQKDPKTIDENGQMIVKLPHGVSLKPITTHVDQRGSLFEMFNPTWDWSDSPFAYAYCFTIRPGIVKGWGYHKKHEDRYCLMFGEMLVVLYDDREDSPTRGLVSEIVLSEYNRCLLNIPAGVWHADQNIGSKDVVAVNFPTEIYDNDDPDKYRLPIDTDKIPYTFKFAKGGG